MIVQQAVKNVDCCKKANSKNTDYIISAIKDLADEEDENCQELLVQYDK